jgi:hypothetical protein
VKLTILSLALLLALVVVAGPGPLTRTSHPVPMSGPPGAPHPPCCSVVSDDHGADHLSAHSVR